MGLGPSLKMFLCIYINHIPSFMLLPLIEHEGPFFAPIPFTNILRVILYGDKRFNPSTNKRIITGISNISKIHKNLTSLYFELTKCIIFTNLFFLFFSFFLSACLFFVDMNVIFFSPTLFISSPFISM